MNDTIKGALIGAIIPTVGAFAIFFLGDYSTQSKLERDTVQVLSEKFDSVEKDMSYEDALQVIYKENENLKNDINNLNTQLDNLNKQIDEKQTEIDQQNSTEEINKIIESATNYWNNSDYVQALSILNSIENKSSEIETLINDYSNQYETYIIEQANALKKDEKLDEAILLLKDALIVIPNSQALKDKKQEIENSYPQNMVDIVPAYQSGGNTYTEYTSAKSGASEYFTMGGVKYTNGMTFNADINIFDDVSWAVYNLDKKYSSLEFMLGHVDGSDLGSETFLEIYYDGELKEEISVTPDMLPKSVSLDLDGVSQLKMQVRSSGNNGPLYGLGNPIIR